MEGKGKFKISDQALATTTFLEIYRRPVSASQETILNEIVPIKGTGMYISKVRATSINLQNSYLNSESWFGAIKFNDLNSIAFPLRAGHSFHLPFDRFYINFGAGANGAIGWGEWDDIEIFIFKHNKFFVPYDPNRGERFVDLATLTAHTIRGDLHSIIVETDGTIDYIGKYDTVAKSIVVKAGQVLPGFNILQIAATSTPTLTLVYAY